MTAIISEGELTLSGDVGADFYGDFFTYSDVVIALAQIDDKSNLVVRLNSGGGIATEGAAIHALLARRAGKTDVVIEGIAASAASLIAMAGKTITMALGSLMMIHDPAAITFGTSADHDKSVEMLEALATSYARVYAEKSKKSAAECRRIMKDETWLTGEEAVALGFADVNGRDKGKPVASFDYRIYAHAPKPLAAMAKQNKGFPHAKQAPVPKEGKTTMAQADYDAGALAATQRMNAVLNAEGIKGDSKRMAAALDIATKNAAMSADDVASFVLEHVGEAAPATDQVSAYERMRLAAQEPPRLAAAGLAQPVARGERGPNTGWKTQADVINQTRGL